MSSSLHDRETAADPARRSATVPVIGFEPSAAMSESETSMFDFAAVVLRNLRWLVLGALLGAALLLLSLLWKPREYQAAASFTPQSTDASRSGITALAGQFGIPVPSGSLNESPQFYADLVRSRVILASFADDTFAVPERGGEAVDFATLFKVKATSPAGRTDEAVTKLRKRVSTRTNAATGTVTVTAQTPWRSASLAIVESLLDRVDAFNLEQRRSQASNERQFVEGRLDEAKIALRAAEDRLEAFLIGNRQIGSAPLNLTRERLQREVALRQGVVSSLTQSYEDVRLREVRDTPVITVIEPPAVPVRPVSRRIPLRLLIGITFGIVLAAGIILLREMILRRRLAGDPHVEEFMQALSRFVPWRAQRAHSGR
ncbi:MAG TPA: hypothetical protein VMM17_09125 [Gemmatimonadaceae bacterium]|nr:hypothetical protein [Gemmatimonadaceae bacterium]